MYFVLTVEIITLVQMKKKDYGRFIKHILTLKKYRFLAQLNVSSVIV